MWYVCDVLYVRVNCFVVRGCIAGCQCIGGSGIVSSADHVLEMSVLRGVRCVGGVRDMCIFGSGGMGGLGLEFTNHVGTGRVWDVCLCCGGVGGVAELVVGLGQGMGWWELFRLCVV